MTSHVPGYAYTFRKTIKNEHLQLIFSSPVYKDTFTFYSEAVISKDENNPTFGEVILL